MQQLKQSVVQSSQNSVPLSKLDLNPGATATVTHLNPVIHDGRQEQLSVGILDSPADEMQNRRQKFGTQLHLDVLFRKCPTYLAKIAVVLQTAPGKMLTFTQVMDRLVPVLSEDRRSVENNTRVCLSTYLCFIKIPVVPNSPHSKKNYWKLDSSQITAKMVRRHFRGILQLFPELATKMETEAWSAPLVPCSALHSPEPAARKSEENKCEAKFSSPFSIESLLKRDSPTSRSSRPPPLSSVQVTQVGIKRSLCWNSAETVLLQASPGITPVCSTGGSTHQGLVAKRMHLNSEPPFPLYTRADPYPSSYITYSVPAFSHDALCFRL
ncbi:forkhead box protein H1-like isoform X1 [Cynoglossus semilaevis]|uniref:Forkhead box protein H1-like n=1 Tax=Cynoglossus semilaevis TaxID=244447 RepID=A0A3P8VIP0_CYNSE|nr:forkhead box protein H1-like isoform X1 [Cynoglossus semilaevis]